MIPLISPRDDFYRMLSNVVAKAHRHDIVTLCGDFNAKVGSDASYAPAILGKHGLGEINDNGVRSLTFVRLMNLSSAHHGSLINKCTNILGTRLMRCNKK